ncbi:unnamed protein product [Lathyrus oleraceus]
MRFEQKTALINQQLALVAHTKKYTENKKEGKKRNQIVSRVSDHSFFPPNTRSQQSGFTPSSPFSSTTRFVFIWLIQFKGGVLHGGRYDFNSISNSNSKN